MIDSDGFRANVGIILCNKQRRLFWGRRVGQDAWQFPQGGIKSSETPEQAMFRELEEEVGLKPFQGFKGLADRIQCRDRSAFRGDDHRRRIRGQLRILLAERSKPVAKEKVWQVDVLAARPQTLPPTLTLFGKVETQQLVRAAAPGAGLVNEVLVKPGDRIQQGQVLVRMDRRDFSAANLQARADVADMEAQLAEHDLRYQANLKSVEEEEALLALAKKEEKRIERLKKNNLSSESALSDAREVLGRQELSLIAKQLEVDRYKTTRKQLLARLSRARARLAETELAIERSEVVAGFNGVVAEVMVAAGDQVRAF